jgi:hypothetical protein
LQSSGPTRAPDPFDSAGGDGTARREGLLSVRQLTSTTSELSHTAIEQQANQRLRMSTSERADSCAVCVQGTVIKRDEELTFYQSTDRGYVFCKVKIPMDVCPHCNAKSWDEGAEAIIEQAVRAEYDRRS